jgi:carboxymethylenebutenolidase
MCFDSRARPPIQPIAGGAIDARHLTLTSADGAPFTAFAARAVAPGGAGVVILPDIRGLHRYYEELALRFAEHAVDAVAIDYFGRTAGLGTRGDDFDWQTHVAQTKADQVHDDVAAAVAYLRSAAGGAPAAVFTIGFCFGGSYSWLQAAGGHGLAGAIGFYGRPLGPMRDGSPPPIERVSDFACPILGLFGGADQGIPASAVEQFAAALEGAGVQHEIVTYPGAPHSFLDRHFAQFAADSADAWARIRAFIARHAGEPDRPAASAAEGAAATDDAPGRAADADEEQPAGRGPQAIRLAYPAADELRLVVSVGACALRLRPGTAANWVDGIYDDAAGALPLHIVQESGMARISQHTQLGELFHLLTRPPQLGLALGTARPFALTLEVGASDVDIDLGGVPLRELQVKAGAARQTIRFSEPNPEPMSSFSLAVGAGTVTLSGLANANCARLTVEGGAATCLLDFDGAPRREMQAQVTTAVSSVEIRVPETTPAAITGETILGGLDIGDGLMKQGGSFRTLAAATGRAPQVTVRATVTLGALRLRVTPAERGGGSA